MPLTYLECSSCTRLSDDGLKHLRGLPLSTLILDHCNGLTAAALDILDWVPESGLFLDGCNWVPGCTPTFSFENMPGAIDVRCLPPLMG